MIFGLEIGMLIFGIIALVTGKIKFSPKRIATGAAARIAGVMLILPMPLALAAGAFIGLLQASQGKPLNLDQLKFKVAIVEIGIVVACPLLAIIIGAIAARPPEARDRKRKPRLAVSSAQEPILTVEVIEESPAGLTDQLPAPRKSAATSRSDAARRPTVRGPSAQASSSRVLWWVVGGGAAGFVFCVLPVCGLLGWWLYSTLSSHPSAVSPIAGGKGASQEDNRPPDQNQASKKQQRKRPGFDLPPGGGPLPPGNIQPPQPAPDARANPPVQLELVRPAEKEPKPVKPPEPETPAERPVPPPIRPSSVIRPPQLSAETVVTTLPSAIADVTVGGGGRYLILHLPRERKLAVFDVSEAKIKGYVPLAGDNIKFTAGRDKLIVALGSDNRIQRWNLATLQREATAPLSVQFKLSLIAMGSNSDGPLLVASADGIWRPELFFMDIATLKKLPIEKTGDSHIHMMEGDGVRASADGRVFGMWSIYMGMRTLVLNGNEARGYHENGLAGHLTPGPDGKVIYTAKGRYTNQVKPLDDQSKGAPYYLPAVQGDYFLAVEAKSPPGRDKSVRGTLTVHRVGEERALITLPEMDMPADIHLQGLNRERIPADKRIYLIPSAKLLIIIPTTNDRLVLHRISVQDKPEPRP